MNDLQTAEKRDVLLGIDAIVSSHPQSVGPEAFPLVHSFGKGQYIRHITMPADAIIVSKIHKHAHPFFILKGSCRVLTENGVEELTAPHYGITPAGTKRVLYILEETEWATVHATENTDIDLIEKEIIADTYDDLEVSASNAKLLKEGGAK